jgi:CspA family cold shock protein
MATGTVKWFNDAKGYGFITPAEGGKDLFVHHSNIIGNGYKSLAEGAQVTFEQREGSKGIEAYDVSIASASLARAKFGGAPALSWARATQTTTGERRRERHHDLVPRRTR